MLADSIEVNMAKVVSSNIEDIEHDGQTLTVKFKSGQTWRYFNVPSHVHNELLNAESIGGYLHRHIKQNYKGERHG